MKLKLDPVANFLVRANDAFATFEGMLIAEIAAGNANAGTPMAACGRVAFGIAWTAARTHILPKFVPLVQDETSDASPGRALAA